MKVYHGTSADNLPSILANGFDGSIGEQIWDCSGGYNYFWNPAALKKGESWIETMEDARKEAIRYATDSAEAALVTAKDCRRVVFEVEVKRNEIGPDTSCQFAEGAVMACSPIPPERITAIWIDGESLAIFKGYFIACAKGRTLRCSVDLSSIERTIGDIFLKSNDAMSRICETLSELELVKYPFDKKQLVCNSKGTI